MIQCICVARHLNVKKGVINIGDRIVKLTFTDDEYEKMVAKAEGMSIQDLIRKTFLSDGETYSYTCEEAEKLAIEKKKRGELPSKFSLPDIYGESWGQKRGFAGVMGRRWYKYITSKKDTPIVFAGTGKYGRTALYKFKEDN